MPVRLKQIYRDQAGHQDCIYWNGVWLVGGMWGSNFSWAESLSDSFTSSNSWQQKLRLTTPSYNAAGEYRLIISGKWGCDDNAEQCEMRVQIDDTLTVWEVNPSVLSDSDAYSYSAFGHYFGSLTEGAHNIDFDYRSSDGSTSVKVGEVRLQLYRRP